MKKRLQRRTREMKFGAKQGWKVATWIMVAFAGIGFIYYGISGRLCTDNLPWLVC